jgi:2',3'-cyclic-nucleotide 2'-phosphodiesterase/3'-nucleotidase
MKKRAALPVGRTSTALHSCFALIGHSPVDTLLAKAQMANMASLLVGRPEASLPMLVSVAPFKAGGRSGPENFIDIPPGPLTAGHIADLYIHPNSPVALKVSGQDLVDWLERSVSLFNQVSIGAKNAPLIDPNFPAFNFDVIHGLSYQIDPSEPPRFDALGRVANQDARRIKQVRLNGQEISPDQPFVLVTNSYRASGGAGFAGTSPADIVMEDSRPLRRILHDYVSRKGTVQPQPQSDWRFVAMPGTSVTFDSSPAALAHVADVPGLKSLDQQPTGFLRFRLTL